LPWKSTLRSHGYLISDGAWGTELAKLGLEGGEVPELWNADHPEAVRRVAESYVVAGADLILTNTFGGNRLKLARPGLAGRAAELNRLGVEISRSAAGKRTLVFASVGPTGEFMAPLGPRDEAEFIDIFAEQIRALVEGGAQGIVVETMTDLNEAIAAVKAARSVAPRLPVVVSMTFDRTAFGFATIMGLTPDHAAESLAAAGVDCLGANCGAGIDHMIEVARLMRLATTLPLWIKPNAGLPRLVGDRTVYSETPEMMAAKVETLFRAGASIIGGCCGTTPDHIRAMAAAAHEARWVARDVNKDVLNRL
jgi:5-methyltetrahydrofolate--homocysteine methyltransferase